MKHADLRQRPPYVDLVRMILDHQLVDSDQVDCGKVDDIEVEIHDDGTLRAAALFSGRSAAFDHLPWWLGGILTKIFGRRSKRIPWSEIALLNSRVKLRSKAEALGLDEPERRLSAWIAKLPRSR